MPFFTDREDFVMVLHYLSQIVKMLSYSLSSGTWSVPSLLMFLQKLDQRRMKFVLEGQWELQMKLQADLKKCQVLEL
jgi:hypothetical protein